MAAKRVRSLPATAEAWRSGELSSGQVNAIVGIVGQRHLERFADHEAALVPTLAPLPVDSVARVMQAWKAKAEALDDGDDDAEPQRCDLDALEAGRSGHSIDGTALAGPALAALACDSALHRVLLQGRSTILDYGTATRTIPAPPPPPPAPAGLGGQAAAGRHLRRHRPRRAPVGHVPARSGRPIVLSRRAGARASGAHERVCPVRVV